MNVNREHNEGQLLRVSSARPWFATGSKDLRLSLVHLGAQEGLFLRDN